MKKTLLFFALCFLLTGWVGAQEIRASSLEGCWIWNGRGEEPWFGEEIVFFGNVILMKEQNDNEYFGGIFTMDSRSINIWDEEEVLNYRLSGNTLTLTDSEDSSETGTYTKARPIANPLEGIWKTTRDARYNYYPDYTFYLLFTRNIMAVWEEDDDEWLGLVFSFSKDVIIIDDSRLNYSVSGRTLTITDDGETMVFTKIY
ncbi:MAG: hypothetical protein LBU88_00135 [Treponema sp.]|jgi:hypothetical protein|nr:hypothetical protein [Treponema sp.]